MKFRLSDIYSASVTARLGVPCAVMRSVPRPPKQTVGLQRHVSLLRFWRGRITGQFISSVQPARQVEAVLGREGLVHVEGFAVAQIPPSTTT